MRRTLILNCDDFGQSRAANEAIMHLLEERKVSSATIMPPALGFQEAAEWVQKKEIANVGLHLTFTSEYEAVRFPSLTGHASLHDETGHMHMTVEAFEKNADPQAVRAEIQAQFDAVKKAGIQITHADNHMGSLYGLATGRSYLPQTLWACSRKGLPFRLFRYIYSSDAFLASIPGAEKTLGKVVALADTLGVPVPDYLLTHPYHIEDGETYTSFKAMLIQKLYDLPEGISETYIHPAVEDEKLRKLIPSWDKRVWEYRLMLDDDFAYALKDASILLTDYRYVLANRKRPRLKSAFRLAQSLLSRN